MGRLLLPLLLAAVESGASSAAAPHSATAVGIDLGAAGTPLAHYWKSSVGSGHARLGLRPDWQQQLKAVHDDLGIVGVRFHGSFDDDMGPVVTGSVAHPVYNFTALDTLYDAIMAAGVTPIVELSFMPEAIANCTPGKCRTQMHYKGVVEPPAEWTAWEALVRAFVAHLVGRHGLAEIQRWRFEVWNEMWGMSFGNPKTGRADDSHYMALYNASYHAIKGVDPSLLIGGPATAELGDVAAFVAALDVWEVKADFVSTHLYPTDYCNSQKPAALDCFTDHILSSRRLAPNHSFLITEYNCGWKNGQIHDGESHAYAASFAFRTVNALAGHLDALSWWTFSSIFEEGNLPTNEFGPFGANSAMQSVHGVPLPVYRGFQLLAGAGNERLPVSISGAPSALGEDGALSVMATRGGIGDAGSGAAQLRVFLSNYVPDDGRGVAATQPAADGCNSSAWLDSVDFMHGDLWPESEKHVMPNASACCEACKNYIVDKFCAGWTWSKLSRAADPGRCYLKSSNGIGNKQHSKDFISGYPGAAPPAPPPGGRYNVTRAVRLTVRGAAGGGAPSSATLRVINSTCANPKALWEGAMKSVTWPSDAQLAELTAASQWCEEAIPVTWDGGVATLDVTLEAYAAASVTL